MRQYVELPEVRAVDIARATVSLRDTCIVRRGHDPAHDPRRLIELCDEMFDRPLRTISPELFGPRLNVP